jgi:hypothetical protein
LADTEKIRVGELVGVDQRRHRGAELSGDVGKGVTGGDDMDSCTSATSLTTGNYQHLSDSDPIRINNSIRSSEISH